MSDQNAATQPKGEQPSTRFSIQKIYVKDVSFEAPSAPDVFTHQVNPRINMQLGNSAKALAQNVHEVVLSLTVTATHEEKTTFLIEVQQAGIFGIEGYTPEKVAGITGLSEAEIIESARMYAETGPAWIIGLPLNPREHC